MAYRFSSSQLISGAALLLWTAALPSPLDAETISYRRSPPARTMLGYASENPYHLRRERALQAARAEARREEDAAGGRQVADAAPARPMRITIPNLRALQDSPLPKPTIVRYNPSRATVVAAARGEAPISDSRIESRPLEPLAAQRFSDLSPSAGEPGLTAPLIGQPAAPPPAAKAPPAEADGELLPLIERTGETPAPAPMKPPAPGVAAIPAPAEAPKPAPAAPPAPGIAAIPAPVETPGPEAEPVIAAPPITAERRPEPPPIAAAPPAPGIAAIPAPVETPNAETAPAAAQAEPEAVAIPVIAEEPQPQAEPAVMLPTSEVAAIPVPAAEPEPAAKPEAKLDEVLRLLGEMEAEVSPAPQSLPPIARPIAPPTEAEPKVAEQAAEKPARAKKPAARRAEKAPEPEGGLSRQSKAMLKKIPGGLEAPRQPAEKLSIQRAKESEILQRPEEPVSVKHESMGVSIEIKRQPVNVNYELDKAYNALIGGNPDAAVTAYKNVLDNDPANKNALFGLATTYHRARQLDQARPLYAKLLALDPDNRDGLNNFLVLLADESPQEALTQMEKLEQRNPAFSPIPAQMAVIYQKLGDAESATRKMFRAVELAPENLTYRYNLAIMLDRQRKYDEAARLYRQLVEAWQRGAVIPGDAYKIQERLTFISSNRQ